MKVNIVKKSRKETRCGRCGDLIPVGSKYYYFEPRFGPKKVRCSKHYPCPSEMTSSDKLSTLYGLRESLEDQLGDYMGSTLQDAKDYIGGLIDSLTTAAEDARGVSGEYEESASNMEEYFPSGSSKIDEIREKVDACESWASELESSVSELEDYQTKLDDLEEPEELEEPKEPLASEFGDEDEESYEKAVEGYKELKASYDQYESDLEILESAIEDILQEARDTVDSAISSLEL